MLSHRDIIHAHPHSREVHYEKKKQRTGTVNTTPTPMNIISKNSCQFFLSDEEATVVRNITKVDALSTAAKSIVRKAIDAYLRKRKSKVRQ